MRRLLHVENDPLVARAVKRLLRLHHYEVGTVLSLEEGLSLVGSFDVSILDIDLGDGKGDGVDLARDLLARGVVATVVFFSARADAETMARASAIGPVVSKTAGADALLSVIRGSLPALAPATSHARRILGDDAEANLPIPLRSNARSR